MMPLGALTTQQADSLFLAIFLGLAAAVFLGAVVLRAATAWVTRIHIKFGLACGLTAVTTIVASLVSLPVSMLDLSELDGLAPLLLKGLPGAATRFFLSVFLVGAMVKNEDGEAVGTGRGALITLVEHAIDIVIALLMLLMIHLLSPGFFRGART